MKSQNTISTNYRDEIKKLSEELIGTHQKNRMTNPVSEIISRGLVCSDLTFSNSDDEPLNVLFLGLNPSYIGDNGKTFDKYDPTNKKTYPRYFGAFHRLVSEIEGNLPNRKINWTQMDILNVRETDSNQILSLLQHQEWINALVKNLATNMKCIENLKPQVIVVCNSKAAGFTGVEAYPKDNPKENIWMGYQFKFNDNFGVYMVDGVHEESILKEKVEDFQTSILSVPFVFTSTLTYMSKYVRKSLAWQISKVLD